MTYTRDTNDTPPAQQAEAAPDAGPEDRAGPSLTRGARETADMIDGALASDLVPDTDTDTAKDAVQRPGQEPALIGSAGDGTGQEPCTSESQPTLREFLAALYAGKGSEELVWTTGFRSIETPDWTGARGLDWLERRGLLDGEADL